MDGSRVGKLGLEVEWTVPGERRQERFQSQDEWDLGPLWMSAVGKREGQRMDPGVLVTEKRGQTFQIPKWKCRGRSKFG